MIDFTCEAVSSTAASTCSNSNFALADLVMERATGMTFNDYVESELFRPAGMNVSTKYPSKAVASGNYSFGHADDGTIYGPDDYVEMVEGFTSAHDLALWGRMMLELMDLNEVFNSEAELRLVSGGSI